jgi:LPS-assembly protein
VAARDGRVLRDPRALLHLLPPDEPLSLSRRIARTRLTLLLAFVFLFLGGPAGWAAEAPATGPDLPPGLEIDWQGTLRSDPDGTVTFTGPVTLRWRESRLQADRLSMRSRRYIEAEGNVLIEWGNNRVFGARMTYDLEQEHGVIEDAMGYALDQYMFWAKSVEKTGDDELHLVAATVTTCTQPTPYWSFAVSSATIHIDHYARMHNVRLRARRASLIYLPYLIWPVKSDRAAGLLMPEYHTTSNRGWAVTEDLFVPLGRSADVTLHGRYYQKVGLGGGGELRFVPNSNGSALLSGFYIRDKIGAFADHGRYRIDYQQTQQFRNGFRMVADVKDVSDPSYYTDFEKDLNEAALPQTLARLEFSRNGAWTSLNVRELRREQLGSTGLVQQSFPEIEWRGRSHKIPATPLYLSFESSIASIQQRSNAVASDADYLRGDAAPALSLPVSPVGWIDITPRVNYRLSYYTQRRDAAGNTVDDGLTRALWSYGIDVVGPKAFRVWDRGAGGSKFKHTIEPQLSYGFDSSFDHADEVLRFDDVDGVSGAGKRLTYSLVQRLFARRPQALSPSPVANPETIILPDGTTHESGPATAGPPVPPAPDEPAPPRPAEPVEIASLQFSQTRSFDRDLSTADLDSDSVVDSTSPFSPIQVTGRFNPSQATSLDLRTNYDILFDRVRDVSLSGSLRNTLAAMTFSMFHRNGLSASEVDSTQMQFGSKVSLMSGRLHVELNGSYDANPSNGASHFPNQTWQVRYDTQCCSFLVERITRDFALPEDRRELYFRVDLTGVGKLYDLSF